MRLALNHQDVRATGLRQVISDTRSDDAAADDDYVCGFHKVKVKRKKEKVKTGWRAVMQPVSRHRLLRAAYSRVLAQVAGMIGTLVYA